MNTIAAVVVVLAAQTTASPVVARQHLDLAAVDAAPMPIIVTVPIGASQQATATGKRSLLGRGACQPQAAGAGPVPSPDTPTAFLGDTDFSSAALNAVPPAGYQNTFTNLQGSCSTSGYLGYTTLNSYDVDECATRCTAIDGCSGFNIYFERDPSVNPGDSCPNPASTTVIKCAFWGSDVSPSCATNTGQYRHKFKVVIAGSNGYMAESVPTVPGYNGTSLGDAAINAPLDCDGQNTYMGFKIFTSGTFDPIKCAAACESQNDYNTAHPPANGMPMLCHFFNTYELLQNGQPRGQICAMYTTTWGASYADNYVSILCNYYFLHYNN